MQHVYTSPLLRASMIAGELFYATAVDTDLDISETQHDWQITTPNDGKYVFFHPFVHASATVQVTIFEGVTASGGSGMTEFNPNRASAAITTVACIDAPTVTGTGTTIFTGITNANGEFSCEHLYIKPNTKYVVRVTPLSDNTKVSVELYWHK